MHPPLSGQIHPVFRQSGLYQLQSGAPVVASLAPSFVANYAGSDIAELRRALGQLGFYDAEETALGAYLLDYISYTDAQERGYYEMRVRMGYRRTAEEQAAIVTATSTEALPDLLRLTAKEGVVNRIAMRFTYFTADRSGVRDMVKQVQGEIEPGFTQPWQVNFYPDTDDAGIVEVVLREN